MPHAPRLVRPRGNWLAFALCAGLGAALAKEPGPPALADPVAASIQAVIAGGQHPELKWPDLAYYQDDLQRMYAPGLYAPIWLEEGRPSKQARDILDVLLLAAERGLHPEDYDAAMLEEHWRTLALGAKLRPEDLGLFDTALSLGLLRHVSDLHIGRVNPKNLSFGLDVQPKKDDLPTLICAALAEDRIAAMVAGVEPQILPYRRLKEALRRYRLLAQAPGPGPLPAAKRKVEPGGAFAGAPRLRQFLTLLGDMPESSAAGALVYDEALVEGVKSFQSRHGLGVDGVLGKATIDQLNIPLTQRVAQLELALERMRWLPVVERGRFILVNIPAFRLLGFDTVDGQQRPALRMGVIVGRALRTQTPIFAQQMRYLIFRPYWNVPYSIAVKELLPKIRKNLGTLEAEKLELVSMKSGDKGQALAATEENLAAVGTGATRLRQRPGPHNSLGLVKFIFPNNANVYLHGTPAQGLFQRPRRDFSHGCVRVEDPQALAEWLLRDQGWTRESIQAAMNGTRTKRVNLAEPVQVFMFYTTAMADQQGRVLFWDDMYRHDARLAQALAAGYPYPP